MLELKTVEGEVGSKFKVIAGIDESVRNALCVTTRGWKPRYKGNIADLSRLVKASNGTSSHLALHAYNNGTT